MKKELVTINSKGRILTSSEEVLFDSEDFKTLADKIDNIDEGTTHYPDYSNGTTVLDTSSSYTITKNGYIYGFSSCDTFNSNGYFTANLLINGIVVSNSQVNSTEIDGIRFAFGMYPVKNGDVIAVTTAGGNDSQRIDIKFVPNLQ